MSGQLNTRNQGLQIDGLATIANGQTTSSVITLDPLGGIYPYGLMPVLLLVLPAAFTGTSIQFDVSVDGTTFQRLYDDAGNALAVTVAASHTVAVPSLGAARSVKLVSSAAEGAARSIAYGVAYSFPTVAKTSTSISGAVDTELPAAAALADAAANPTTPTVGAAGLGFNGTTWDRLRTATADALASTGLLAAAAVVFNGSTWDRLRTASADALAATGLLGTGNLGYNGSTWDRIRTATADALAATGLLAAAGLRWNGASWDRERGNLEGTLLASAARTATTTGSAQTNYNARGAMLILNVSAASGTGGLTVTFLATDPVSGAQFLLNANPTAVTGTGTYVYELYPGASTAGPTGAVAQRTAGILPRTWTVKVFHGDASSYTYSVGYELIV